MAGQIFYLDPHRSEGQSIPFEVNASARLTLLRDGAVVPGFDGRKVEAGRMLLDLERGRYEIRLIDESGRSARRRFEVR
jgi:hypothetical protein